MPKRISVTIVFTVVIAVIALFAATKVMAFCDFCEDPVETLTKGGWTITLKDISETSASGWYDWWYEIKNSKGKASGLNFAAWLVADCCGGEKIKFALKHSTPKNLKYFPVGVGEPVLWFGRYNQQARVLKGTSATINWHLIANTRQRTASTIILRTAKGKGKNCKKSVRAFEMAAPACPKQFAISTGAQASTFGDDKWVFAKTSELLECFDRVYGCDAGTPNVDCIDDSNLIAGQDISGIRDTESPAGEQRAVFVGAGGECIVWAQFGTNPKRCPIIGGKKYCR